MLLEDLVAERGITKQELARAAGITSTAVMSPVVKAKGEPRAYAPRPGWLELWADRMGLVGEDRAWFILLGLLAGSPSEAVEQVISMRAELLELRRLKPRRVN
jgi:hypothetical protein